MPIIKDEEFKNFFMEESDEHDRVIRELRVMWDWNMWKHYPSDHGRSHMDLSEERKCLRVWSENFLGF